MPPIQRADPVVRKWLLVGLLVFVVLAYLGWREFSQWLVDVRSAPPAEAMRALVSALRLIILAMGLSLIGLAVYMLRLSKRTRDARRYPPTGVRVVRDTAVLEGEAAAAHGRLLQTTGYVLAVLACLFVVLSNVMLSRVVNRVLVVLVLVGAPLWRVAAHVPASVRGDSPAPGATIAIAAPDVTIEYQIAGERSVSFLLPAGEYTAYREGRDDSAEFELGASDAKRTITLWQNNCEPSQDVARVGAYRRDHLQRRTWTRRSPGIRRKSRRRRGRA